MNVVGIRTGVEELLKCAFTPVQKGPWTAAQFLRNLNAYQDDLFVKIAGLNDGYFETEDLISEVAGTSLYSFPTTLFKVVKLERISGNGASTTNPLEVYPVQRDVNDEGFARSMTSSGSTQVEFYRPRAQKQFELIPASSQTLAGALRVTNIFKPAALVNDTDVPFQKANGSGGAGTDSLSEWHDILMLGVAERLCKSNKEMERAAMFREDRAEREQALGTLLKPTNKQRPRHVNYEPSIHDALWT